MALRVAYNSRLGYHIAGQSKEFERYERDIRTGRIPCPFTAVFSDREGNVVTNTLIPVNPSGKPKYDLFG